MSSEDRVTYFAETDHRNNRVRFGIKQKDRRSHFYVTGKTGTGKSHLLRTMILQDIANGQGCALFDPHGDLSCSVRDFAVQNGHDVLYIDPADPRSTWRLNPLAGISPAERPLATAGLVEVFKKLWVDDWGPRLEHLLRNVIFTLLEIDNATLADASLLLSDRGYRNGVVWKLENEMVRSFWKDEFEKYSPAFRAVVTAPLQNKLGALLTDPRLNMIFTEPGVPLQLPSVMERSQVILLNLDKGRLGDGASSVIGSFVLSHIALAGLRRSAQAEKDRVDFIVYLDEFQTFTTQAIAGMLSELRKYRVGIVLANQHLSQLDPTVRDAVFGNVGSIVSFRVGAADAAYLAREFAPVFEAEDLLSLPRHSVYVKLLIDGESTRPFSAHAIPS